MQLLSPSIKNAKLSKHQIKCISVDLSDCPTEECKSGPSIKSSWKEQIPSTQIQKRINRCNTQADLEVNGKVINCNYFLERKRK